MKKLVIIVAALAILTVGLVFGLPSRGPRAKAGKRVMILGCDGMEPSLTERMLNEGRLPNFAKLRAKGCFMSLGTSTPPQSPVAWSDFITGCDARVHAIYDFIHRNPDEEYTDERGRTRHRIATYLSTSKVEPPETWTIGTYEIPKPWSAGSQVQLRRGKPFWEYLTEAGVPATIFRAPSNFPPDEAKGAEFHCLSGMGTPDLHGGYGIFSTYAMDSYGLGEDTPERQVSGGFFYRLGAAEHVEHELALEEWWTLSNRLRRKLHYSPDENLLGIVGEMTTADRGELSRFFTGDADKKAIDRLMTKCAAVSTTNQWTGWLIGPPNDALKPDRHGRKPNLEIPFRVARDPEADVASVEVQGQVIVLNKGEWSGWQHVDFETGLPGMSLPGICRFFLLEVHSELRLYVTPLNMDPEDPVLQISQPSDYCEDIAAVTGPYYTMGIPEDHSALQEGALTEDEYLSQARIVLDERMDQLDYALHRFHDGFLFFYFGTTDQVAHLFWRELDPEHPLYDAESAEKYGHVIEDTYVAMDQALGKVMKVLDEDDTLIVMSDHGFTTFRRGFNLNTWLRDNGYIKTKGPSLGGVDDLFVNCDWGNTQAYGLGINCLYVNLRGREFNGIVAPGAERDNLLDELRDKLLQVTDPENGKRVIDEVYRTDRIYPGADPKVTPDLLIGYARGYRASWDTVLGAMPDEYVVDNDNRWSGDHCIATRLVPGIVLSNRQITIAEPRLIDLGPTVLAEFGIDTPETMQGRPMF